MSRATYRKLNRAIEPIRRTYIRVSRQCRCPICDHADWCVVSGDNEIAICMRVESSMPAKHGGFIHRLSSCNRPSRPFRSVEIERPIISPAEWELIDRQCRADLTSERLSRLASDLGVNESSLQSIGIGWHHPTRSYSFPMRNADHRVVGMRLRTPTGSKRCITGSRLGIVIPDWLRDPSDLIGDFGIPESDPLLICEGESDTAAALDLGFRAIARPGCETCVDLIVAWIRRMKPAQVAIVADNDEAGRRGAHKLAGAIHKSIGSMHCRIVTMPGAKDLRQWRQFDGASHNTLLDVIEGVHR